MRRRIFLVATVVAGASLGLLGVGIVAASGKTRATVHYTSVTLNCPLAQTGHKPTSGVYLTVVPPPGSTAVALPVSKGTEYGFVKCPTNNLSGVTRAVFNTDSTSGNTSGTIQEFFGAGKIQGTFRLVPQGGGGGGGFGAQTWTGIVKFTSGSGIYSGLSSRKPYTFDCSTPDSVHISCSQDTTIRVKVRQ